MWMLSSTICVGLQLAQAHIRPAEAILMPETEIFQLYHTLAGISMMVNVTVEVEKLKIMVIYIR